MKLLGTIQIYFFIPLNTILLKSETIFNLIIKEVFVYLNIINIINSNSLPYLQEKELIII